MTSISNEFGNICLHKTSMRGLCDDYILTFNNDYTDLSTITSDICTIIEELLKVFNGKMFKARLIAKISFYHLNDEEEELRVYYFPSYSSESVNQYDSIEDWTTQHLTKIGERLDSFHANGSNLIINKIEHLHICISKRLIK